MGRTTSIIDIYAIHDETVDFSGLPQNKLVGSFQTHQSTGGWFNFIDFEPVLVYLEAGEQWLVFCSPTPVDIMNVASIRVDYVADKKPEPPEETEPTPIVIPTTPEEPAAVLDTTNHADLFGSTESYSSTTYVSHFGNLAAGSGFSYFLNIPADGTYSLTFYVSTPHSEYVDDLAIYAIHGDSVDYANLKSSDRVGIFFNDQNTGGWTNFVAATPVEVYLKAGEQYLVIKSMSSHAGYINVSKLELAYVSDEKPADSAIALPTETDNAVVLNNKNASIYLGNIKVEEQNFGELTAGAGFGYEIKVEAETFTTRVFGEGVSVSCSKPWGDEESEKLSFSYRSNLALGVICLTVGLEFVGVMGLAVLLRKTVSALWRFALWVPSLRFCCLPESLSPPSTQKCLWKFL